MEKLLKLDPSNTELLAQKQRLLTEEVQATKEKLEALKNASEQANAALEAGTVTQDQYDALQREIIETQRALEDLETQASLSAVALQKISATGTKFQEAGGKIEGVGKSLLPVTAAITGIGAAGIKVASDFEKAMSGVQAITGATGEDFETLREKAIELGATTSFSAGEVAEAMTEMAKAGWTTTQIIDGMAGVLDATAASGESLGTVSTIVADAITGFGLKAKDSARVADLMTQAANSGTIGVADLGESYKYVAPLAQSMGLSIEDVTTALSAMSMAGIKGSQAGTSLRTVLANMAKPSKTVATAMEELGLSITNSDGSFKSLDQIVTIMRTEFSGLTEDQQAYYATALAGKEGMSGLISLLNLTQEEYDALSASMSNCSGIAGETASVMQDNLQSKVEQLGGSLESLAIKLSEYVIPYLTGLVEKITAAVEAFTNLSPGVQKAILVIAGVVAVAGPLLIVIGKVISAVGTIMTIIPKLAGVINVVKTAFAALNATMLANPIVLIIAAIAALVAAFIHLWNTNEAFRQFWIDLWENIKQVAIAAWNAIKEFLVAAWQAKDGLLSAEDAATYAEMEQKVQNYSAEIARMEEMEAMEAELNKPVNTPLTGKPMNGAGGQEKKTGRASNEYKEAMLHAIRNNFRNIRNVLSEGIDTDGGYLVPEEYDSRLIEGLEEENIFRRLGTTITTSGERKINIAGSKPAAAWIDEGEALTFGDAKFDQINLDAHKLHVAVKVTEELLYDNAFGLENYLIRQFSRALANAEEDAFLNGDGTGKPLGIFAEEGGGEIGVTAASATEITADEIINLVYALKRPYRKKAKFIMNDATIAALRKLKDENGQYLWQPSLQAGEPDRLFGYEVMTSAYVPIIAAGKPVIAFGDFSYYNIGDRGVRSFAELKELFAGNGMVGFVAKERVDGKLVLAEAVQVLKMGA